MTLIAAWKMPHKEGTYDKRGIRVIADAMLSDGSRQPISPDWTKVHVIRPRVRIPVSSCDEDWHEAFNHWGEHYYKRFGIFFAGAWLPFSFVVGRVREVVESLGLNTVYRSNNYVRTDIVRGESARQYGVNQSMHGGHFNPPPPLNLELITSIVAEEFSRFYASLPSGAFVIAPNLENHGTIQHHTFIGIAGYCDATKRFRLFKLSPEEDLDDSGIVKPVPKITLNEVADDELLLLGSNEHQEAVRSRIAAEQAALAEPIDEQDRPSLARQAVIEREISTGIIPGVGGAVVRAEVDSDYGFQIVNHPWSPAEKLDFSMWEL